MTQAFDWTVELTNFVNTRAKLSGLGNSDRYKLGYIKALFAHYITENPQGVDNLREFMTFVLSPVDEEVA